MWWSEAEVLAFISVGLLVGLTAVTFAVDVARTDGWTFGQQSLSAVWGGSGCGLGDEIDVMLPGSLHGLQSVGNGSPGADGVADAAGFENEGMFASGGFPQVGMNQIRPLADMGDMGSWVAVDGEPAESNRGSFRSRWHAIAPGTDVVALMVMGRFPPGLAVETSHGVAVQWGSADGGVVEDLGIEPGVVSGLFTDWRLLQFEVPTAANRVRLLLRDDSPDEWLASSLPLGATTGSLTSVTALSAQPQIMLSPPLALYFPCIATPPIAGGIAQPPAVMAFFERPWQTTFLLAASTDRYYELPVEVPNRRDHKMRLVVSEEYLTGQPARANAQFANSD